MQFEGSIIKNEFCYDGKYIKPALVGAVHPKQDQPKGDKNNCTVRTLANCTSISYDTCHELMLQAGRKLNDGMSFDKYFPVYQKLGAKKFTAVGNTQQAKWLTGAYRKITGSYPEVIKGMTLKTLLSKPEYQRGVFAVEVNHHIMAIRNGLIHDTGMNLANKRVVSIIEFSEA